MKAKSQPKLIKKLSLVKPGANVFGGGIWNPKNDLNWAFQQVRDVGKPGRAEYEKKAEEMLKKYVPTLVPKKAGELIREIHTLAYKCIDELVGQGMETIKARKATFALIKERIGAPDSASSVWYAHSSSQQSE